MFCRVVGLTFLMLPGLAFAQVPDAETQRQHELAKKPQYERLLTGEDAKKAEKLAQALKEHEESDAYNEAIQSAEELLALRVNTQGADHYEAVLAKFEVSRLESLSLQPAEKRREWRAASGERNEAQSLRALGQYANTYPALKRYADLCRELLGEDHPDTATSFNNLAFNLVDQGKPTEAQPHEQKALEIQRKLLGEDHPETASSYNAMGFNLFAQGKAAEAQLLFQKALDIRRKVLGEDHTTTATSYNNVASSVNAQGKAAEAEPLYKRALDIRRKVLGEDHKDTANSYNGVATNLSQLGRASEAQVLFQRALDIKRNVYGEDHPDIAVSYTNVASSLNEQGKAAESEPLFQKALELNRKFFGGEHPRTATSYNNLGANLNAQGKAAEAAPLIQKSLEIRRKFLGEDHPETAQGYSNVASNLNAQGKTAEAEPLYLKSLEIRRKLFGDGHPDTADSYNSVASYLNAQGKADEARPLYQKALEIFRKVLGEDHPHTAMSYSNVAFNLTGLGKASEAGPLLQRALDIRRRVLGDNHPHTALSYDNLAQNLYIQGRAAEAQTLNQKALEIFRGVLGSEHPETCISYNNLAYSLYAQGKVAEADAILRQAIFSAEASRLNRAEGIERAIGEKLNPRLLLAAIEQRTTPAAAWENVEATLARGLLDQQRLRNSNLTPDELAELTRWQDRITDQQAQILKLVSQTNRSESDSTRLKQLITERSEAGRKLAALAVTASTRELATNDEIQAALPADAALLMWIDVSNRGDVEEHFACVIRRTGDPKWERLPGTGPDGKWSKEDSLLFNQLRAELAADAPSRPAIEAYAKKLQAQRIAPVFSHLKGVKTLYVVGVQAMAGIPVSLLTQEYTIGYVPSGTFLARRGKSIEKPSTLLALGDPTFPAKKEITTPSALPPGGLLVKQVVPGGPASKALLQPDDVLVSYAGTNLESVEQLGQLVAEKAAEKSIAIQIWRAAENKLAVYEIAPGKLGVMLAKEPARDALAARYQADQLLASVTRRGEWVDLPGSQVELRQLTRLFEPGQVTALTRSEASEPGLNELRKKGELTSFRYLHFATHGEANNVKAFDSKLILAQDHPQQLLADPGEPWLNNELSAREVLEHWKLDAELVTLSACETAIGKSGGGDGMLGFAQAFLVAGSRSVCLSLWKVDDTATTLLMDRFYRNLLGKREDGAKPMGKAAALNEAQSWLRNLTLAEATDRLGVLTDGIGRGSKKGREVIGEPPVPPDSPRDAKPYSHPKYWAAFVLIGDPD